MRSSAVLLALVSLALASPLSSGDNSDQLPLDDNALYPQSYPGFDLDLTEQRLVLFEGDSEPVRISELDKIHAKAQGLKFFDVTETPDLGASAHLRTKPSYPTPNNTEAVGAVIDTLEIDNLKTTLTKFSSFRTRYYRSDTGKESQKWLLSKIEEYNKQFAPASLQKQITVREFAHSWTQSSIIVRINGSSTTEDGVVVIGAHLDSTNTWPFLPAPGADDDGSGSTSILEAYRALIAANFRPERTVEFHWYSAEEGGLLGSQAVARDYESRGVNVYAMSQYDMTAWVKRGTREEVGIITDYVDSDLTAFNEALVDKYLAIPYVKTKCGYACSDHASWGKAGYPSVFTIESSFENSNHYIHSSNDRIDVSPEFSFSHMREFSKLAVAFAIELGGWKKSD